MPTEVKQNLVSLGFWSMQYSIAAILRDLPTEPAIAVNRNVLDGLLAQAGGGTATLAEALPLVS